MSVENEIESMTRDSEGRLLPAVSYYAALSTAYLHYGRVNSLGLLDAPLENYKMVVHLAVVCTVNTEGMEIHLVEEAQTGHVKSLHKLW
jgi:hypothetical protein